MKYLNNCNVSSKQLFISPILLVLQWKLFPRSHTLSASRTFYLHAKMHILVHIYMCFLIFFYFFIVIIRFWDEIFGESATTSGDVWAPEFFAPPDMSLVTRLQVQAKEIFWQRSATA